MESKSLKALDIVKNILILHRQFLDQANFLISPNSNMQENKGNVISRIIIDAPFRYKFSVSVIMHIGQTYSSKNSAAYRPFFLFPNGIMRSKTRLVCLAHICDEKEKGERNLTGPKTREIYEEAWRKYGFLDVGVFEEIILLCLVGDCVSRK